MSQPPTLAIHILQLAARQPDAIAYSDGAMQVSYRNLRDLAVNMALNLRAHGVGQGGTVAVASADHTATMATVLAAGLLGARCVAGLQAGKAVDLLLTDSATGHPKGHVLGPHWARVPAGYPADQPASFPAVDPDAPWLVLLGATGPESLTARQMGARVGATPDPAADPMALQTQLAVLAQGRTVLVTPPQGDLLLAAGRPINAALVDMAMRGVAGVRDAMCFLLPRPDKPPRLTAFVCYQAGVDSVEVLASVRVEIIRVAGLDALPERFLLATELPRDGLGRPDRAACARMVQAGIAKRRAARGA